MCLSKEKKLARFYEPPGICNRIVSNVTGQRLQSEPYISNLWLWLQLSHETAMKRWAMFTVSVAIFFNFIVRACIICLAESCIIDIHLRC